MSKCPHDPIQYKGMAMGMYHCPECGDMVLAGLAHPEMDDKKIDEYFDGQYEKFKTYVKSHVGQFTYEFFFMFLENMPNMKGTMLEIWLRAEPSFREQGVFDEDTSGVCSPLQSSEI